MSRFLFNREFLEHTAEYDVSAQTNLVDQVILFKQQTDRICISLQSDNNIRRLSSSYYVGCDWLIPKEVAIMISPKIILEDFRVDHLKMMLQCLRHPEVLEHADQLFEIKFSSPGIEIDRRNDLLTPLLIIQFLINIRSLVRKGLKRTYYRTRSNLNGKVKGKILIGRTIKENVFKNRLMNTACEFDEFGFDGVENRILKRTLKFIRNYLSKYQDYLNIDAALGGSIQALLNYALPAFEQVSDDVDISRINDSEGSILFKEYTIGLKLAKLILNRGSEMISVPGANSKILTPPFWIDMAKLFELYVLGLLKDKYGDNVIYHFATRSNELDFLVNSETEKIVVDAKYKPHYKTHTNNDDMRQVSGYARMKTVYNELGIDPRGNDAIIDCVIVYPDQSCTDNLNGDLKKSEIPSFVKMYKVGVSLPTTRAGSIMK